MGKYDMHEFNDNDPEVVEITLLAYAPLCLIIDDYEQERIMYQELAMILGSN